MESTKTIIREHETSSWRKLVTTLERDPRGRHEIRVAFYYRAKDGQWRESRSLSFLPSESVAVSSALDHALDHLSRQTGDNR